MVIIITSALLAVHGADLRCLLEGLQIALEEQQTEFHCISIKL